MNVEHEIYKTTTKKQHETDVENEKNKINQLLSQNVSSQIVLQQSYEELKNDYENLKENATAVISKEEMKVIVVALLAVMMTLGFIRFATNTLFMVKFVRAVFR